MNKAPRILSSFRSLTIVMAACSFLISPSAGRPQTGGSFDEVVEPSQNNGYVQGEELSPRSRKKPAPSDVNGTWCGTLFDNRQGDATVGLILNESNAKLTGTWTSSMAGTGPLKGKVLGDKVTLILRQPGSQCKAAVSGVLVEPEEITGHYSIFGCNISDGGTFDISTSGC